MSWDQYGRQEPGNQVHQGKRMDTRPWNFYARDCLGSESFWGINAIILVYVSGLFQFIINFG